MEKQVLSSSVYGYVLRMSRGSGKTLGEIAAQARVFESGMYAWYGNLYKEEKRG